MEQRWTRRKRESVSKGTFCCLLLPITRRLLHHSLLLHGSCVYGCVSRALERDFDPIYPHLRGRSGSFLQAVDEQAFRNEASQYPDQQDNVHCSDNSSLPFHLLHHHPHLLLQFRQRQGKKLNTQNDH